MRIQFNQREIGFPAYPTEDSVNVEILQIELGKSTVIKWQRSPLHPTNN